jgi:membrane-associated phospholipid phosphatase
VFRLAAASEPFRAAVPDELVPVVWAVTMLGSAKFLMVGLSLAYWNLEAHREKLLALVSTAFLALAATLLLKYWFHLPRPPVAVQRYPVDPSPVGFPSGHAISATVVYGGVLVVADRYRDPRAVLGVGALVLAVGLSRVVLGVHYLGDILAGFAVGLVALGVLVVALERGATAVFALAVALSVPAVVVTGGNADATLALGGSLGALAGTVGRSAGVFDGGRIRTRAERALLSVGGLVFVGAAVAIAETVESLLLLAGVANFALAFGIVALPALAGRADALADPRAAD